MFCFGKRGGTSRGETFYALPTLMNCFHDFISWKIIISSTATWRATFSFISFCCSQIIRFRICQQLKWIDDLEWTKFTNTFSILWDNDTTSILTIQLQYYSIHFWNSIACTMWLNTQCCEMLAATVFMNCHRSKMAFVREHNITNTDHKT